MKIIANDYDEKDVMRFLRESTNLTQEEFGKSVGKGAMSIQGYERGVRNYSFSFFMKVIRKYGYKVTIEKNNI